MPQGVGVQIPPSPPKFGCIFMNYLDNKEGISYFEFGPCPKCGKSSLSLFAHVNSLHFANFMYYLLRCENTVCNNIGWIVIDRSEKSFEKKVLLALTTKEPKPPSRKLLQYKIPVSSYLNLPENVFHDFDQAYQCLLSEFYDASVCMARRALERVLLDKGAQCWGLSEKIRELEKRGKLPPETATLCDDIKNFGDKGAHAYEPTEAKDADYAIIWTDIIIAWLYGSVEPISNKFKS